MKNVKNSIIQKSSQLFAQRGTQAVTMEDVAKECGISKKTVYLFFSGKEELILDVVKTQLTKTHQYLSIYSGISPDAITELNNFFGCIEKMLDIFTPVFIMDIKTYFPEAYELIVKFKTEHLLSFVHQNINRGITEEMYRSDLKKDILGKIYSWELNKVMEENDNLKQSGNHLVCTINNFFLHSLVNIKGKKLLLTK